jgi:biotin synthase
MNKHSGLKRYILGDDEFLNRIEKLYKSGRRIIMIQSGEIDTEKFFCELYKLLQCARNQYPDVTLMCSFGNLSEDKYKKLRDIGIDRYLLKFETSNPRLYKKIKPSDTLRNRLAHIRRLKKLGFHVSSGNITGLPGQTLQSLAEDILLLKELDLPMGSTSVFIPNNMSNYANYPSGDVRLALNFTAILRIVCPTMVIPATSSLELVIKNGQYLGLMSGANAVTLHDGTPHDEENKYVIYKKDRYKPKDVLFGVVKKAGLWPLSTSLIREKSQDTVFYKLINKNLGSGRIAVYAEGRKYTYGDLLALTSKFCSLLQDHKIKEGQVVVLAVFDSIEFIVAFLSCIRLGIIVALADPQLSAGEWKSILSDLRPQRILTTDGISKKLREKRILKITDDDSSEYFFSLLERYPECDTFTGVDRNSPAMILYTSGTTGRPKGVIHAYQDLFVDNFPRTILKITDKDIIFSCSKIHTSFGLGNSLLFPFHFGASVILSRNIPNPLSIQKILELKPTLFLAVPSMYDFLLERTEISRESFRFVRLFVASGEKLYGNIFKRWRSVYKKNLVECYGSSEMSHPFISNIPGREKGNSCGTAIEGFHIRFDKSGRIFYNGPSLFSGYFGDNELTQKKIFNGWFESDDIGYRDKNGYISIRGRTNLVFKLHGKWISILDIEDNLKKCRLIREIVVVSGEEGLDYYVSLNRQADNDGAERDIRRYCMRNLKIHELPKKIYIVNEIPKTPNGKIDRQHLKYKNPSTTHEKY